MVPVELQEAIAHNLQTHVLSKLHSDVKMECVPAMLMPASKQMAVQCHYHISAKLTVFVWRTKILVFHLTN